LINRLTDHANGKVEMTATQVRATEILLRKILPDLSDVKMDVDAAPITFNLNMTAPEENKDGE